MEIDWVLFDADGVIQGVRESWLEDLTRHGGAEREAFLGDVFAAESATVAGGDFATAMRGVLERYGIAAPLEEVIQPDHWIVVDPAMLDAVRQLRKRRVRCALATNQQNLRGGYMRSALGFDDVFDAQFYSWELGTAKPDPRYFRAILSATNAVGSRTLFIDDNATNVAGARTAGLHAELFPRGGGVEALHPILERYGLTA